VIFPEPVEKILSGETEAARILEPGYVGSVRRYHSRWREENWTALSAPVLEQATRIEWTAAELASEHWGWLEGGAGAAC
jgi:monoamine oxidase